MKISVYLFWKGMLERPAVTGGGNGFKLDFVCLIVNTKVCLYIDENDPGEKRLLLIQERGNEQTNSLNKNFKSYCKTKSFHN